MENTQKFNVADLNKNIAEQAEPTDSFATLVLSKNSAGELSDEELDVSSEISNERYFLMKGRVDLAFATRHRTNVAILMLKVDDFSTLKKVCAPAMLEGVLGKLGKYIKSELRLEDTVARLGDDMYGMLLISADPLGALEVAERVRQKIKRKIIRYEDKTVSISVSVGVSAPPVSEQRSFNKMLHEARGELAKAIASGGDALMAEAVRKRIIEEDDGITKKNVSIDDALNKLHNNQAKLLDGIVTDLFTTLLPLLKYCDGKMGLGLKKILDEQSKSH